MLNKFRSEGELVVACMFLMRLDTGKESLLLTICDLKHLINFSTYPSIYVSDIIREDGFISVRHCAFRVTGKKNNSAA